MAAAYAAFARAHPSHYQTMFSGVLTGARHTAEPEAHGVLLTAIRRGQEQGRIRAGDPQELAEVTWALSHGIATLGMAGQLPSAPADLEALAVRAWPILDEGMGR